MKDRVVVEEASVDSYQSSVNGESHDVVVLRVFVVLLAELGESPAAVDVVPSSHRGDRAIVKANLDSGAVADWRLAVVEAPVRRRQASRLVVVLSRAGQGSALVD